MEQQIRNRHTACGEIHGSAKLKVDDVHAIRELARHGVSQQLLGSMFGVSTKNIGCVVRRETWRRLVRKPLIEQRAVSERPMRLVVLIVV